MPTLEERLTTLEWNFEQFKVATGKYYQEMAMQVTLTKGLAEDAVKRLWELKIQVDQRFNRVDEQLSEVKQDLSGVKQDLNEHTKRLNRLETKVDAMQTMLEQILERLPEKP